MRRTIRVALGENARNLGILRFAVRGGFPWRGIAESTNPC